MKKYYHKLFPLPALVLAVMSVSAQTKELSLQEALQLAAKGNRQLQLQWLESRKAAEAVKEAKSFLLPVITVNGGYTVYGERPVIYLRNEDAAGKPDDVKFGGRFSFDGSITANYPILNPGLRSDIRLAGITEQIRKEETKMTEEQLALRISQLYLAVLMNKEQVRVLQQSLLRNERALKDSRSLFLQGKSLKTDTLSNHISVQNLKAAVSALENNTQVLSVQLKQLIGMEDNGNFVFTDSLSPGSEEYNFQVSSSGLSIAFENRKDIKIQSLQVDQGREQLQKEKANYRPQLWAVAQYQVQSQADNLRVWDYGFPRTSFAGVKLTIPIYSGNRLKYRTTQADISIRQQELALTELRSTVQTELVSLTTNLQEARNQWRIQQQNVDAAQINYTMMNDRYRYGLGSRLELTDAELALTKAKLDHLLAVYSIRLIGLQIQKATGTLQLK